MLMKLLVNIFERARSKLVVTTRSHSRCSADSDVEISNFDAKPPAITSSTTMHRQPRSTSLSKWFCPTPSAPPQSISTFKSTRINRSNSWRSLKERENHSITPRTYSVDQLHRNKRPKHASRSATQNLTNPRHTRYDRLSSTLVNPSHSKKPFATLSHHSTGADSGYSDDSFATRTLHQPTHPSCPHCHCEQQNSPSNLPKRPTRTLADRRRRNLSCDSSLWSRAHNQKAILVRSSPVFSEPNHHHRPFQRHFPPIGMTHCQRSQSSTYSNANIFGELNLAAIELDSLRTSFSSSTGSSSSLSSIRKGKQYYLVWKDYQNSSLLSKRFAVRRGDQVRVIKQMGKSTLLVQKQTDGTIGFLPQTCLAHHQINSFLTLKGLRETVL